MQFKYITIALAAAATNVFAAPVQNEAEAPKIVARTNNAAHFANQVNQINQHLINAGVHIKNQNKVVSYCVGNYFNNCFPNYRSLFLDGCNVDFRLGYCGGNTYLDYSYLFNNFPNFLNYDVVDGCNSAFGWNGCYNYPVLYKKDAEAQQQEE